MGNAGSSNIQRERQKFSDMSTPNSPFSELPSTARDGVTSQNIVDPSIAANVEGSGAEEFNFDKKPDTRSVLNGSSSQEDEEQPYYTKLVGSVVSATVVEESMGFGASDNNGDNTFSTSDSVAQMTSKESADHDDKSLEPKDDETSELEDKSKKTEHSLNPALPTVLRWDGGGRNVMISGTFSKWKPIPMVRSHGNFVTIIDLPMGDHQYMFCVDGEWKHDPKLKNVETGEGERINVVSVRHSDFEVFQALAKDSENAPNYAEKEYSQEVPQSKPWEKISGPPVLPPHLLQVILNKDTPLSCEPTLLPEPNHVMLNHLYALSIKDGVMVLSATHRYRKKYVTTLLYKPI